MADVHDVAAYIVSRLGNMSTMKLQKLCYYSQGWHLAWEGKPLFRARIEAWRLGPVVRELYAYHRLEASVDVWEKGDASQLSHTERSVIDDVLAAYKNMSGLQLSELTHQEEPWLKARGSSHPGASSNQEVKISDMEAHFRALAQESRA
ncbi:Panacea domain-containing protein [Arthrobacter sp. NPDC058192]|uniref:Panacea domain-containing protein n=1 Tax=Arthrobacter sp. NPDC058192 TaxID=3346372 RepID=UPI0036F0485D